MMPDISPVTEIARHPSLNDIMGGIGVLLASFVATMGLKRGEKDRHEVPASSSIDNAGIALGILEQGYQRDIAADTARTAEASERVAGLTETVANLLSSYMRDLEEAKREDKDRTTDNRLNTLESNQGTILGKIDALLKKMDESETASSHRHATRRGEHKD